MAPGGEESGGGAGDRPGGGMKGGERGSCEPRSCAGRSFGNDATIIAEMMTVLITRTWHCDPEWASGRGREGGRGEPTNASGVNADGAGRRCPLGVGANGCNRLPRSAGDCVL